MAFAGIVTSLSGGSYATEISGIIGGLNGENAHKLDILPGIRVDSQPYSPGLAIWLLSYMMSMTPQQQCFTVSPFTVLLFASAKRHNHMTA